MSVLGTEFNDSLNISVSGVCEVNSSPDMSHSDDDDAQVLVDGGDGQDSFQLTIDPDDPSSVVVNTNLMDMLTVKSTESTLLHTLDDFILVQSGQSVVTAAAAMQKLSIFSATSYLATTDLIGGLEVEHY